jgi:TM2 domain-containing membrane protein YozV/ribosomal protein L40E
MSEERVKSSEEKFCQSCGAIIKKDAEICPKCGVRVKPAPFSFGASNPGSKQRLTYILLGIFLGGLGIHNFYAGYTSKGVAQLLITLLLGWLFGLGILIVYIWVIIEIVTVTVDANGEIMS